MNMIEYMNDVVNYIEEHLDSEIDYGHIAKITCSSQYDFQRMFIFVTGTPLSEYIRRRRLTLAACELQGSTVKIIDIALKYGYQSADAFARAFHNMHGITPSNARNKGITLTSYSRIAFSLSIKGVIAMNYKIVEKEKFTVVGIKEFTSTIDGENRRNIPQMWRNLSRERYEELMRLSNAEPSGVLGVCADMYNNGFDYWIAAATTNPCPSALSSLDIPASTWAIFEATGPLPDALQELWTRIYTEWLPASGYEHAPAPEIEWYSEGDSSSDSYKSEVWIPVVKK